MLNINNYHIEKNVHIYRQGDINIAYDVNSGSLHIIDEKTYALLRELIEWQNRERQKPLAAEPEQKENIFEKIGCNLSPEEKEEILLELAELQANGLLFTPEAPEIEPVYPEKPVIKAMCLHVAHDCNLRCKYCFAGTGSFQGRRELMSLETGKKALDFLLQHSGSRLQSEVDFFGGEPLLNLQVIRELIIYGKKIFSEAGKTVKFTLTTNAVLLDKETADYLESEGVSVVLSLDGRPEVHDKMRPYPNGKGSYEQVVPHIVNFAQKRPQSSPYAIGKYYYVRGTYTHYNTDFYQDVLHMVELGVNRVSVEPVVASPQEDYAFREGDIQQIKESYDILGEKVLEYRQKGREFTFFHFNAGLDDGPCLPKRLSGCGAGHAYVAISPEGDIYPCHQFVGQKEYKLGSLHDPAGRLRQSLIEEFRKAHIYNKEECRLCWARFSCSGGCHAANAAFSGKLTKVYTLGCELQKKRLEVAYYLRIKAAREAAT